MEKRDLKVRIFVSMLQTKSPAYEASRNKTSFINRGTPEEINSAFNIMFRFANQCGLFERKGRSMTLYPKAPPQEDIQSVLDELTKTLAASPCVIERIRECFQARPVNYAFEVEQCKAVLALINVSS